MGMRDDNRGSNRVDKLVPKALKAAFHIAALGEMVYQLVGGVRSGMGYSAPSRFKNTAESPFHPIIGAGLRGEPRA